ncbi:MAG TPA: hypothetical protein VFX22_00240 [Candidatus Kapabacteria bacterium]|nr:hypothetical protein [Candidatus Kapabacteria bacterium]
MASENNGRLSRIEELLIDHDERMAAHDERMAAHDERMAAHEKHMASLDRIMEVNSRALENTERLLVLEGDRIDRSERIEIRQNELFAEISEQLKNMNRS